MIHVHDGELLIRHIHIDDTCLRNQSTIIDNADLRQIVGYLINERINGPCHLSVTSDIHIHLFQLQLINQLAITNKKGNAVINGDILCRKFVKKDDSSRSRATDTMIDALHRCSRRLILVRGNHETDEMIQRIGIESSRFIPEHRQVINDTTFIVKHKLDIPSKNGLFGTYAQNIDESSYLIVGHANEYYIQSKDLFRKYADHRCIYYDTPTNHGHIDPFNGSFEIDQCQIIMKKHRSRYLMTVMKDDHEVQRTFDESSFPLFIDFTESIPIIHDRSFLYYSCYDMIMEGEISNIRTGSHVLCTNNLRVSTKLYSTNQGSKTNQGWLSIGLILGGLIIAFVIVIYIIIHDEPFASQITPIDTQKRAP